MTGDDMENDSSPQVEKEQDTAFPLQVNDVEAPLSNSRRKKLLKRQKWLEQKPMRKAKEKEKRKLKIQQAREDGRDLGPSRKFLKSQKMSQSSCQLKICFDLSLADVMTEQEFSKTFKQLHRCYSINRRAPAPLQLYITGYSDATKQQMSTRSSCFNWDVNFSPSSYSEVLGKDEVVYLTSDSPNEIDTLDHSKAYVIGALVDHNRLKNFCYEKAQKDGVSHARLPLDMYFRFKTRKVLTIDQVYLIFLRLSEGKSWVDAVMDTVPKRKGVELKSEVDESGDSSEDCDSDSCETDIKQKEVEPPVGVEATKTEAAEVQQSLSVDQDSGNCDPVLSKKEVKSPAGAEETEVIESQENSTMHQES